MVWCTIDIENRYLLTLRNVLLRLGERSHCIEREDRFHLKFKFHSRPSWPSRKSSPPINLQSKFLSSFFTEIFHSFKTLNLKALLTNLKSKFPFVLWFHALSTYCWNPFIENVVRLPCALSKPARIMVLLTWFKIAKFASFACCKDFVCLSRSVQINSQVQ